MPPLVVNEAQRTYHLRHLGSEFHSTHPFPHRFRVLTVLMTRTAISTLVRRPKASKSSGGL